MHSRRNPRPDSVGVPFCSSLLSPLFRYKHLPSPPASPFLTSLSPLPPLNNADSILVSGLEKRSWTQSFSKATWLAAERLVRIVARRLTIISSQFPHKDDTPIPNVDQIYDDLLEILSRPNIYPEKFREEALRLVLVQIGSRETAHLIKGLVALSIEDLHAFLSDLMRTMCPLWFYRESQEPLRQWRLGAAYRHALSSREKHSNIPFIDFISSVAQLSSSTCHAVLRAGYLDMLLLVYIGGFRDRLFGHQGRRPASLLAACNTALLVCASDPECLEILITHPLHILWPRSRTGELINSVSPTSAERYKVWRKLTSDMVEERISSIHFMVVTEYIYSPGMGPDCFYDAIVDLLEFASSPTLDSNNVSLALGCLSKFIATERESVTQITRIYFEQSDYNHFVNIIVRLVHRLPRRVHSTTFHTFCEYSQEQDPILNFIRYTISIAEHESIFKEALLEGGIINLILPIYQEELQKASKYAIAFRYAGPDPIALARRNAHTLKLLDSEYGYGSRGDILAEAFDVLFRRVSRDMSQWRVS